MAKAKRDGEGVASLDRALVEKLRGYALALESGRCTSGDPEDMESLAENLEMLAREVRQMAGRE